MVPGAPLTGPGLCRVLSNDKPSSLTHNPSRPLPVLRMDLFAPRPPVDPAHLATVKGWAAELLFAGTDAPVMVTQLACREPGCPPLETVIGLLERGRTTEHYRLHKAVRDITHADVAALAGAAPGGATLPEEG